MARPKIVNRVIGTTQSTGTGTIEVDAIQQGFQGFGEDLKDGDTTIFGITDSVQSPTVFELTEGTVTLGATVSLTRDRVITSTNGGNKINLEGGTTYTVTGTVSADFLNAITDVIDSDHVSTGSAGAYAVTTHRNPTLYDGYAVMLEANHDNPAGPTTLNVNAGGAVSVKLSNGTPPHKGAIKTGGKYLFVYDGTNFQLLNPSQNLQGVWPIMSNGGDTEHDIDFGEGGVWDDTGSCFMAGGAMTKRFDETFAEGTNAGGAIGGVLLTADSSCHIFRMGKADGTIDHGWHTSLSPTLPTGFIYKRWIGSLVSDGSSNLRGFTQVGNYFGLGLVTKSATNNGSVENVVLPVPAGIRVKAEFTVLATNDSSAALGAVVAGDAPEPAVTAATGTSVSLFVPSAALGDGNWMSLLTNLSGEVRQKAHVGNTEFHYSVRGYEIPGLI